MTAHDYHIIEKDEYILKVRNRGVIDRKKGTTRVIHVEILMCQNCGDYYVFCSGCSADFLDREEIICSDNYDAKGRHKHYHLQCNPESKRSAIT